jgi:succinate-acetate transporter protein
VRDEGNAGLGFGNTTLVHVGGYLGIVLSVIGFYAALETVVNETVQPYGCSRLEHPAVAPVP